MKKRFERVIIALLLLIMAGVGSTARPAAVWAAPNLINYQGDLTDSGGSPVTDGSYTMTFRIYDTATAGTPLWEETQGVTVTNGIYNALLGSGTTNTHYGAFDATLFSGDNRWLEVVVNGEVLTPRQRIASTAFSLQSQEAAHAADADTLAGQPPATYDQSTHAARTDNPHGVTAAQAGAATPADLAAHASDPSAHHTRYADAEAVAAVQAADGTGSGLDADLLDGQDSTTFGSAAQVGANQSDIAALQAAVASLQSTVSTQATTITALQDKLQYVTVNGTEMHITGANLHIENGAGTTYGAVNGLGNLIIGYNELRFIGDDRSGSHNLIIGSHQNYSSYGGLAAGYSNTISGPYASVSGGAYNTSGGNYSSVSGGRNNTAGYSYASVSGGRNNTANGQFSSVSGGWSNTASGSGSSISGGSKNTAGGHYSSVSGGESNTAGGEHSSVSGGSYNNASGYLSSVVGGGGPNAVDGNVAFADYSAILGGLNNLTGDGTCSTDSVTGITVCTGGTNHTLGQQSTVSGGSYNTAGNNYSSVNGGTNNTASGWASSVSGGTNNTASGSKSSVSGGGYNYADGEHSSVSGGTNNSASGLKSSVSGGSYNIAFADYSAILGGLNNLTGDGTCHIDSVTGITFCTGGINHTLGQQSTVSGGRNNNAGGNYSSVNGGKSNTVSWNSGTMLGTLGTYSVTATSTVEQTVTIPKHGLCALEQVSGTANDGGTNRWCKLTHYTDDTWTLAARTGIGQNQTCQAVCY